jgi:hypothetical protein
VPPGPARYRKIGAYLEQRDGRETVGRILCPSKHRQSQLLDDGMTQFMETHEQHIAGHEFDQVPLLPLRHASHAGIAAQFAHTVFHLGAGGRRLDRCLCRRRLRNSRRGTEQESKEQRTDTAKTIHPLIAGRGRRLRHIRHGGPHEIAGPDCAHFEEEEEGSPVA